MYRFTNTQEDHDFDEETCNSMQKRLHMQCEYVAAAGYNPIGKLQNVFTAS